MFDFVYKTIPELDPAQTVAGDELLEAVQGGRTVRISASQLQIPGKSAYQSALEAGFVGTEQQFNASLNRPEMLGGAVFITAITPQTADGSVGDFVHSQDGYSLLECSSTTRLVRVHVSAITGFSNYKPLISVNGLNVAMVANADAPTFSGYVDLLLPDFASGSIVITANHVDGAKWHTTVHQDIAPQILNAAFISQYPGAQTELKAGDLMSIRVTSDLPIVGYEIADVGCFPAYSGTCAEATVAKLYDLAIADRGNVRQIAGFRVRVSKANGAWSQWFSTADAGSSELQDVVALNNVYPAISIGSILYPDNQLAIKAGESALVENTVTNFDTVTYSSEQLLIDAEGLYETAKAVSYLSGGYTTSESNFTVTARRTANGAVAVVSSVVAIANATPVVSVRLPATRLRSGGNAGTAAQLYPIVLVSDQTLAQPPVLNVPEGQWADPVWTPSPDRTEWTRRIQIHDDDVKGTYSFNSLTAIGLAGRVQSQLTGDNTYTIGGFVFRVLSVPAYPNREVSIGTVVTDSSKLRCTNLSKGATGALNVSYQTVPDNSINHYSVTDPSGVANPNGWLWYNCDALNATSNTTGTMKIEIEETI